MRDRRLAAAGRDKMRLMRIGVLALQGAFREHRQALQRLGAEVVEVRLPGQLEGLQGLVIPGGESTTMAKLLRAYDLEEALKAFYRGGGAIWGTCAGAIAVARDIEGFPEQPRLGLMDIGVARNAYGRQRASFETELEVAGLDGPFRALFIRAPRIVHSGPELRVLASYQGDAVMVAGERLMATVFHPELSGDDRVHAYFLECVVKPKPTGRYPGR
ncbi:pyridoxal 5'-phosphate synthase glutaminase subunit PdxT [soil metagenome]|jgi:5'-phosphate synthase pdxT subunit|nr:pyridoxal 5'-phosphate synthase glutaminase subunit PdxT [Deinococcota bacterium]